MKKTVKKKLKIVGMHCSSCAMSIDFDLEDLDGVKAARTNYAREVCEVEYDGEKVNIEKIILTVKKTGYEAKPLSVSREGSEFV